MLQFLVKVKNVLEMFSLNAYSEYYEISVHLNLNSPKSLKLSMVFSFTAFSQITYNSKKIEI